MDNENARSAYVVAAMMGDLTQYWGRSYAAKRGDRGCAASRWSIMGGPAYKSPPFERPSRISKPASRRSAPAPLTARYAGSFTSDVVVMATAAIMKMSLPSIATVRRPILPAPK